MTKTNTRARARKPAKVEATTPRVVKARKGRATKRKRKPEGRSASPILVWDGVTLHVSYNPHWLKTKTAHLEINVVQPEGAPLPVTDTGYRSHFLNSGIVEEAGGPLPYVQAWLDREARNPAYRRAIERWRQLDLFA
jgi:hypothetical protein